MERYQQGHEKEAAALISRLSPELFRFFLAREATRSEAHDLLQDTWLRIHRVRHTYRPGAPLLPWIFAIARRVRVDGYRKRSRISRKEQGRDELPDSAQADQPDHGMTQDFQRLMAQLPEGQREVITLLKVNGLSLDEVARATGLTLGAVKQKASRAYRTLRTLLQAQGYRCS